MKMLSPALARAYVEVSSIRTLFRCTSRSRLHRLCGILVCGLAAGSAAGAATPGSAPAASASSIIGKEATLNGSPIAAGATLFSGDVIRLGESSTAALRFGNNLVLAAAGTELVVEPGGVRLRDGFLQVRAAGSEPFGVSGPFFHLNVAAAGGIPSSAEVHVTGARAQISAVAGAADLTSGSSLEPLRLHAGETANLDATGAAAPAQNASNPDAGQISRLTPQVQIDRDSQRIVAAVSDRVFWNDDLRSGPTGRAHVTLKDGSQLNLGSDSSLRILQHDAGAQQTSLDLLVGRLRGRITKLSRPGAKFEIHTPMGIAGLVGTDFSLLVTSDYTELMVFDGSVRFTPASGAAVVVNAGMKARFSKAGLADGPVAAGPQEIQTAKDLTDIVGNGNQVAAAGASRPLAPLVITLTGVAAGIGIGVWQATRPTVSVFIP